MRSFRNNPDGTENQAASRQHEREIFALRMKLRRERDKRDEILRIEKEVREQGGEPEQRLRDKCNWEHMSRTAVIRNWGDPRDWDRD